MIWKNLWQKKHQNTPVCAGESEEWEEWEEWEAWEEWSFVHIVH